MDKGSLTSYCLESREEPDMTEVTEHTLPFIAFLGTCSSIIHALCSYPKEHFLISKVYSFSCTSLSLYKSLSWKKSFCIVKLV